MNSLVGRYKWFRKKKLIQRPYNSKYAFVGMGNHSLHNLYPVISYLNVPLKYIVSRSARSAELIRQNYTSVIATTNFEEVINDPDIQAVFICADPSSHFQLAKQALSLGKHVFVEKPVCLSSNELEQLINIAESTQTHCLVGMQKRYSTCTQLLKERLNLNNVYTYNYRFGVGAYPEGNIIWDIFIHPIDLVTYLFGDAEIISVIKTTETQGRTSVLLQLQHKNIIGNIEVSTAYSWNQPFEKLDINTCKGFYEMENHQSLIYSPKPKSILFPLEKIVSITPEKHILFNGNTFVPVAQNNQLVYQGYYGEVNTFVNICEGKTTNNISSLKSFINTFHILESIQSK